MVRGKTLAGLFFILVVSKPLYSLSEAETRVRAVLAGGGSAALTVAYNHYFTNNSGTKTAIGAIVSCLATYFLIDAYLATFTPEGRLMEAERLTRNLAAYPLLAHEVTNQEDLAMLINAFFNQSKQPLATVSQELSAMRKSTEIIRENIVNIATECTDAKKLTRLALLKTTIDALEKKIITVASYLEKLPQFNEQAEEGAIS